MRILIFALIILCLSACVQVNTQVEHAESQLAISSSHDRDLFLNSNSTYAFTPLQQSDNGSRFPMVTTEIEQFFNARDYQQVTPEDNPTFYIGYILERSDELSDEQLGETFGLNPGLPDLPDLEKGTMLIFVLEGESKQFAWRGAAQGFVLDDLSQEERNNRIKLIVHSMLSQFERQ